MNIVSVSEEITGLGFPEAMRWRNGSLWWSDMFRGRVMRYTPGVSPSGVAEVVWGPEHGAPVMPGGLGWLHDGTLLVVDCLGRRVMAVNDSLEASVYADLSDLTPHPLNDMCVDSSGVAWVGGYGFDPETQPPATSPLYLVGPDQQVTVTESAFVFPNGMEQRGSHIVVAETFADRVSTLGPDGSRVSQVAWPEGSGPDGISHSPTGHLVVASAFGASLDVLSPEGEMSRLFTLDTPAGYPGGPRGVFDCAYHPTRPLVACSVASLDEAFGHEHDTGMIMFIHLDGDGDGDEHVS
jgi:sugar lactone lactonase YvrE